MLHFTPRCAALQFLRRRFCKFVVKKSTQSEHATQTVQRGLKKKPELQSLQVQTHAAGANTDFDTS